MSSTSTDAAPRPIFRHLTFFLSPERTITSSSGSSSSGPVFGSSAFERISPSVSSSASLDEKPLISSFSVFAASSSSSVSGSRTAKSMDFSSALGSEAPSLMKHHFSPVPSSFQTIRA